MVIDFYSNHRSLGRCGSVHKAHDSEGDGKDAKCKRGQSNNRKDTVKKPLHFHANNSVAHRGLL